MAGFWDYAIEGVNRGVPLGVRTAERKQDMDLRAKERQEDSELRATERAADFSEREGVRAEEKRRFGLQQQRSEEQAKRDADRFEWESTDRRKKEQGDKTARKLLAAHALFSAGEERKAADLLADTYNNDWMNGDQIKILYRSDAQTPEMAAKWDSDPNLKGKDIAVVSQKGGIMPFKTTRDVFKFAAANLSQKNFYDHLQKAEDNVATMNAKEQPFVGEDGHRYVQTWELGRGGIPQKGPIRAYTDVVKESELQKKVRETEQATGGKMTGDQKRVVLGLREKEQAPEPPKPGDSVKTAKEWQELTGKQRDQFKKDLDLVLRPFSAGGKPILDMETGEMTAAGENALESAGKLIDKHKKGDDLTPEEKRKVQHAYRAWEIYKKISGEVSSDYGGRSTSWRDYVNPPSQAGTQNPAPGKKATGAGKGF